MKHFKNLNKSFEILGLNSDTTLDDAKKAYHELAKKYHPDKFQKSKDKQEAETKFIEIKNAYDDIIEYFKSSQNISSEELNNNFSNFFNDESNNENHSKYKSDHNTKNSRKEMIDDFERYIKNNNISQFDIYNAVYNKEPIYKDKLGYKIHEMLVKDNIYRSHIKSTVDYMKFEKNINFVKKMDVHINLYYDPIKYQSKPLNFNLIYKQKTICSVCGGWSCSRCKNGIITKNKKLNVKVTKCEDEKTVMVKGKGHISPWKNGNIIINLISKPDLIKQKNVDFEYRLKRNYNQINSGQEQLSKLYENTLQFLKNTYLFLTKHKIHVSYISVILVLVVIIILLICLL